MVENKELFISIGKDDKNLYVNSVYGGSLIRIDAKTKAAEYLAFPKDGLPDDFLFSKCFVKDGNLLYLLDKSGKLLAFNSNDNTFSTLVLPLDIVTGRDICYLDVILDNNRIYVFQKYSGRIIIVDLEHKNIRTQIIFDSDAYIFDDKETVSPARFCGLKRIGNTVHLITGNGKYLVSYNLSSESASSELISHDGIEVISMNWRNGIYYLLDFDGNIYYVRDGKRELFYHVENEIRLEYGQIVATDNSIWIFPGIGEEIKIIDLKSKNMLTYMKKPKDLSFYTFDKMQSKFYFYYEDDAEGIVYFANPTTVYMPRLNKKTDELFWVKPVFKSHSKKFWHLLKNKGMVTEDEFSLAEYLQIV